MFTPTRNEARLFITGAWTKHRKGQPLSALEQVAAGICALHPEYHAVLESPDAHLDTDYAPESGDINPFLHLSLHLAVAEQLSVDQPKGIRAAFARLRSDHGDEHGALHAIVECLGEVLWQAQRMKAAPDATLYLDCIEACCRSGKR